MKTKRLVSGLHHASVRVDNLDEAYQRWCHLLGLHGEKLNDREAILRCAYEEFAVRLQESPGTPCVDYVCYELQPEVTFAQARAHLTELRQAPTCIEVPLRGRGILIQDPDGNKVVLVEKSQPEDRRPNEVRFSNVIPGLHPRKLGHVNYLTANVNRQVQWYTETLGFDVTDWIGEEGVWLHVNADHHVLAFLEKGFNHIHHLAFELVDWGELRVILDHLARNQRHLVWGPGRHGMARNIFSYFRMSEEEHFVELFCDLEQLTVPHEPRHFPDDPHSSNTWGILPPRTYFRFDQAAIKAEEEQTYAYENPIPPVP